VALLGKAMLINWSNVRPEDRSQYYAWHDREHMAGRLGLPGFLRGRRLWASDADRDVLNIYEVDDFSVLTGPAYSAKASKPSPAYLRAGRIITDAIRALAHIRYSRGTGVGGWMLTMRFAVADGADARTRMAERLLPEILELEGVVGVHLCEADKRSSAVITTDRVGRPTAVPDWAILVEATRPQALDMCRAERLTDHALLAGGCTGPFHCGTYCLQMVMTKQDLGIA